MKVDIGYQPEEIQEGMTVRFTASTSGSAKISECKWSIDGPSGRGVLTPPDPQKPDVTLWDTTGLQPGAYRISVEAALVTAGPEMTVASTEGAGAIDVDVRPRLFSATEVEGLVQAGEGLRAATANAPRVSMAE